MIAGTLEIQMLANMARLSEDMGKAKGMIGTVEAAAKSLNVVLGTLGVALGSASLLVLIKQSIDAANHLEDLSKSTSLTVDELAGLSVVAKQSGTDIDGLAKGIDRMSVAMGKSPDKFRALGVTAKDPLEAFKQMSDIFKILPDVQQRNALAQSIFNKSWAELAPILSLGSQRIGEAVERGRQLSGVTEEITQQATAFNSKWVELTGTGGLFTRMVGPALPLLNMLAAEMLNSANKADGAEKSFSPLKDTLQVLAIIYANLAFMAKTAGNEIAGTAAQVATIAAGPGGLERAAAIRKAMLEDAAKALAELDAFEKKVMGAGLTGKAAPGAPGVDPAAAAAAAAKAKEFLRDDYAARVAVIKIGGEAYAEAVRVNNQLADLAMKEGGVINQRTQEELIQRQQTETADLIFEQMKNQQTLKGLAQQGEQTPKKVEDAAKASAEIEKLNAKLIASETITQAQIRAQRTITALQQADQYNAATGASIAQGEALAGSLRTATDRENVQYQTRLTNLAVYLASAQGQIADAADLQQQLEVQHQQNLLDIERNKHQAERSMQIGTWQLAADLMQTMAGKSKAAAIAAIAINKGLAIAQVIQSTAAGSARAFMDLPYYLAVPAAASIEAMGAIQIGLIAATGLMQAASVGGGGASMGSPANPVNTQSNGLGASTPSTSSSAPPQQIVLNLTVNGHILNEQQFTDTVMVPALRDAMENRDVTIFGPNSRQAQNIVAETTG